MNTRYCSICSSSFDVDDEGDEGQIGIIPFAFCGLCKVGVLGYAKACEEWDELVLLKTDDIEGQSEH